MTPKWQKRTNNQFLLKNHDIFTTPVSFAHYKGMSRPGFKTQWFEIETETRL